jgi:hypothetical protein
MVVRENLLQLANILAGSLTLKMTKMVMAES